MDIYIWITLMVVFFIMELVTASFFLVWFGVGINCSYNIELFRI